MVQHGLGEPRGEHADSGHRLGALHTQLVEGLNQLAKQRDRHQDVDTCPEPAGLRAVCHVAVPYSGGLCEWRSGARGISPWAGRGGSDQKRRCVRCGVWKGGREEGWKGGRGGGRCTGPLASLWHSRSRCNGRRRCQSPTSGRWCRRWPLRGAAARRSARMTAAGS